MSTVPVIEVEHTSTPLAAGGDPPAAPITAGEDVPAALPTVHQPEATASTVPRDNRRHLLGWVMMEVGLALAVLALIWLLDGALQSWAARQVDWLQVSLPEAELVAELEDQLANAPRTARAWVTNRPGELAASPVALAQWQPTTSLNLASASQADTETVAAPPIRLLIPALDLNSAIVETKPVSRTNRSGEVIWQWEAADYAVGHQQGSSNPGAGSNIVLTGHNNTMGAVFRYLHKLAVDDEIVLYTADGEHHYRVRGTEIVPYRSQPEAGEATLQRLMAATTEEQITLISCYPYLTNADRIVVTAEPVLP